MSTKRAYAIPKYPLKTLVMYHERQNRRSKSPLCYRTAPNNTTATNAIHAYAFPIINPTVYMRRSLAKSKQACLENEQTPTNKILLHHPSHDPSLQIPFPC
jgi:hypothetical protein